MSFAAFFFFTVFFIFSIPSAFAMTVPPIVYNGASFIPVCGANAVFFDVPNAYPPMLCGMPINFGTANGVTYEVRDLDEDGDPIPPSAYVQAVLGSPGVGGCTNSAATNYNPLATFNDGSCILPKIGGCTDSSATNYNSAATFNDGSCTYAHHDTSAPISAPSSLSVDQTFTPVCGANAVFFDVPNAYPPMLCGMPISFSAAGSYEVRGLDEDGDPISPSVYVSVTQNEVAGNLIRNKIKIYNPVVNLLSPLNNTVFSSPIFISYKATDESDLGYGLGTNPVSIFYSNKSSDWVGNILVNRSDLFSIVKNLPAIGDYSWVTKNFATGVLYRIIVDATNLSGKLGEAVSNFLSLDFTPPTFVIQTNSLLVRKGDVRITITASKDLSGAPKVMVTQNNGSPISVSMASTSDAAVYQGSYAVLSGYDGTAHISVSGTDLAGNSGNEITSGGTFDVGVNPPPIPGIISKLDKTVVGTSSVNILGTIRPDTQAVLVVNGEDVATATPDVKGSFAFDGVQLDKIKNHGENYINIFSIDPLGNESQSADMQIKYNIPPTITITKPESDTYLSGQTSIVSNGVDENQDPLLYTYQIISVSDFQSANAENTWTTLATNVTDSSYDWDSTEANNGEYMIRVIAFDGNAYATSTPVHVYVKNTLPYARFDDGERTVTKNSDVIIIGHVFAADNAPAGTEIASSSYSIVGVSSWTDIKLANTSGRGQEFSIPLSNLAEGVYSMLFTITDNNGLVGRTRHTIIVDQTSPLAPIIKTPLDGANITDADDEDSIKSGLQISFSGTAENGSIVSLVGTNGTSTTIALPDGSFSFLDVTLEKGKQNFVIFATDPAGNESQHKIIHLTYDNPPVVNFLNPKSFGGLSGKGIISWNITSLDNNPLSNIQVSYNYNGGAFKTLVSNAQAVGTYNWNTSTLPESNYYQLKISATDGFATVTPVINFSIDRTPPVINSFHVKLSDSKNSFVGSGTARDNLSGVAYVEYAIQSENNATTTPWYEALITSELNQSQASFSIQYPLSLSDGTYTIHVRAVDAAGNLSPEMSQSVRIDTTSPRIGSFFLMKNTIQMTPDISGNISVYASDTANFAVSLESDTQTASLFLGDTKLPLTQDPLDGLWKTQISFDISTSLALAISATDTSGNITDKKEIGNILLISPGSTMEILNGNTIPVAGAHIFVLKQNDQTGEYSPFIDASGVAVTLFSGADGTYNLILPEGTFKIVVMKSGYKTEEQIVSLDRPSYVSTSFTLHRVTGIMMFIDNAFDFFRYHNI